MAIDGEPRNGDFARYIEQLSRTGGPEPGKVDKRAGIFSARPAPPPASASEPLSSAPWGQSPASPGVPARDAQAELTLAQRDGKRRASVLLGVAGIAVGIAAARVAFQALQRPYFDLDELMPAVFLGFLALMLFKAATGARKAKNVPARPLPPLQPSRHRKDG
jgi:hypothetical protein